MKHAHIILNLEGEQAPVPIIISLGLGLQERLPCLQLLTVHLSLVLKVGSPSQQLRAFEVAGGMPEKAWERGSRACIRQNSNTGRECKKNKYVSVRSRQEECVSARTFVRTVAGRPEHQQSCHTRCLQLRFRTM